MARKRHRIPELIKPPTTFHAKKTHVVCVFHIGEDQTIGIRFDSPEMILEFMSNLMEKAKLTWPNNEWVKEYLKDD